MAGPVVVVAAAVNLQPTKEMTINAVLMLIVPICLEHKH